MARQMLRPAETLPELPVRCDVETHKWLRTSQQKKPIPQLVQSTNTSQKSLTLQCHQYLVSHRRYIQHEMRNSTLAQAVRQLGKGKLFRNCELTRILSRKILKFELLGGQFDPDERPVIGYFYHCC